MGVDQDFWRHIWDELEPRDLPGDLEVLALDLGMDATRQLTEYVRGRLYVPVQNDAAEDLFGTETEAGVPPQLEDLAENVGRDVAQYLAQHWGGTVLYVPVPDSVVQVYRDQNMMSDLRDGMTIEELADRYDLSTERIMQILRSQGDQKELWDHNHTE